MHWEELPTEIRGDVERWLGSSVVEANTQSGGFSPGVAARLRTASGRRIFLKAVSNVANPESPGFHRQEALITAAMPSVAPVPRLLEWWDRQADLGWVILALEDIDGRQPRQPWDRAELGRVVGALDHLAEVLTPSPLAGGLVSPAAEWELFTAGFWKRLERHRPAGLDAWCATNLESLATIESGAGEAALGNTLLHCDLRADNILLSGDRVWFVDWPWARVGAAWVDLVAMAPSVAMQGGPSPEEFIALSRAGREAPKDGLRAVLAAIAGYFVYSSFQPAPPGLPTLRAFQAAQGEAAVRWLQRMFA